MRAYVRSSGDPRQSWRSSVTPLLLGCGTWARSHELKYPLNLYRFLNLDCPNLIGGFQILLSRRRWGRRSENIIFRKANQIAGAEVPAWSCEHRRCFTILLQTLLSCSSNLWSLIPQIVFYSMLFFSNLGAICFYILVVLLRLCDSQETTEAIKKALLRNKGWLLKLKCYQKSECVKWVCYMLLIFDSILLFGTE